MKEVFSLGLSVVIAIVGSFAIAPHRCIAGTTVTVGSNVAPSLQIPVEQIDHQRWDNLLEQYVDQAGNVNYAKWKQSTDDLQALDSYLATLSTANPNASKDRAAKLAFWINAYNSLTVRGILREYPTTSIRNHTAKLFGYNIWDDLLLIVGGEPYSLNQIEHEVLRKMGEPRIHFAIVCASRGCPRLRNEAYTPADVDAQLSDNATNFFANSSNFQYNRASGTFKLSAIMNWFADDFGNDRASQLRSIAPFLPSKDARDAAMANAVSVVHLSYNWGLNEQ
ncbi:DUF547 domain-containing protein [Rubripirellula amarantea]|nr:DUF547 domain-containing protein [Rubripirellula amarantea]